MAENTPFAQIDGAGASVASGLIARAGVGY
jgi:hypothetical protein